MDHLEELDFDALNFGEAKDKGKEGWESEDESAAAPGGGGAQSECGSEPGDLTCAICLGTIGAAIPLEELAMVKGCDHVYCVKCILQWALHKEQPWCPQCKMPFDYLLTYRALDGTLQDFPSEESVVLLKRAVWFEEHMRSSEKGKALLEESRLADDNAWQDYADEYDLADDDEIEAFYFSSAAGRARVLIGNRRFGEGGFVSGGRRQARPLPRRYNSQVNKGKGGEYAVLSTPPAGGGPSSSSFRTPNAGGGRRAGAPASGGAGASSSGAGGAGAGSGSGTPASAPRGIDMPGPSSSSRGGGGMGTPIAGAGSRAPLGTSPTAAARIFGSSPSGSSSLYGSSPAGSGRRARRNARRAAQDYAAEAYAY